MILRKQVFAKSKRTIFIVSFLALSLIHFAVFWCYINFDTIRLTFYRINQYGEEIFVGGENYLRLFKDIFERQNKGTATAFWNSFHAIGINMMILPLSIFVAYALYKKVYGYKFFRIIFYIPSVISIVVLAAAFREMFRQYNDGYRIASGPAAQILSWLGINKNWLAPYVDTDVKWPLIYTFAILNGMGTNVILIASAMNRIPKEITEASRLDGCGYFNELFHVSLPLVMPTITTWVMMIFSSVYSFFMQPMLLLDGNPGRGNIYMTAPWQIFDLVTTADIKQQNLVTAACLGLILTMFILPLNLIMRALLNKFTAEVSY